MNSSKTLLTTTAVALALGVAGCEANQTEEGSLPDVDIAYESGQMPKYDIDVKKTQDGKMPDVDIDVQGGNLPAYDVDTAEVSVDSNNVDVTVPTGVDVETEEKTVSVPAVDVTMPGEDAEEEEGE